MSAESFGNGKRKPTADANYKSKIPEKNDQCGDLKRLRSLSSQSSGVEDSGSESGDELDRLNAELLAEVRGALAKLEDALPRLGNAKSSSIVPLVTKLQCCLKLSPNKNDDTEVALSLPSLGRKCKTRRSRHTVGVSKEEIADARKLLGQNSQFANEQIVKNALRKTLSSGSSSAFECNNECATPNRVTESATLQKCEAIYVKNDGSRKIAGVVECPQPINARLSNSRISAQNSGTCAQNSGTREQDFVELSQESNRAIQGNVFQPKANSPMQKESFWLNRVHEYESEKGPKFYRGRGDAKSVSPFFSSSSGKLSDKSSSDDDERDTTATSSLSNSRASKNSSRRYRGANSKKNKIKRANTVDVLKILGNDSGILSGEESCLCNSADELFNATSCDKSRVSSFVPNSFRSPKTENDRKFFDFLNRTKDEDWRSKTNTLAYNPAALGGQQWSNRFSNIKTAFESIAYRAEKPTKSGDRYLSKVNESYLASAIEKQNARPFSHAFQSPFRKIDKVSQTDNNNNFARFADRSCKLEIPKHFDSSVSTSHRPFVNSEKVLHAPKPFSPTYNNTAYPRENFSENNNYTNANLKCFKYPRNFIYDADAAPKTIKKSNTENFQSNSFHHKFGNDADVEAGAKENSENNENVEVGCGDDEVGLANAALSEENSPFGSLSISPKLPSEDSTSQASFFSLPPSPTVYAPNDYSLLRPSPKFESWSPRADAQTKKASNVYGAGAVPNCRSIYQKLADQSPALKGFNDTAPKYRRHEPHPWLSTSRNDLNSSRNDLKSPRNDINSFRNDLNSFRNDLNLQNESQNLFVRNCGSLISPTLKKNSTFRPIEKFQRADKIENNGNWPPRRSIVIVEQERSPPRSPVVMPSVLQKSESWHQMIAEKMKQAKTAPPVHPRITRNKTIPNIMLFPKQYEAALPADTVTQKQKTVREFLNKDKQTNSSKFDKNYPKKASLKDDLKSVDEVFENLFKESNL